MRKFLAVMFAGLISVPVLSVMSYGADMKDAPNIESMSIEELLILDVSSIVTASKKEEKIQEASAVVTIITDKEIKDFGAVTLYDVIQRVPSVQILGSHLYPRNAAVMRGDLVGHYDNHMLVLINGRPFRDDLAGGQNSTLYDAFPVEVIERIEVVRGPGSVLYGTDAFDGVINIITKKPAKNIETELTVGAGSFGANIRKGTFGYKKTDLDLIANVNYFADEGWDFKAATYYPATNNTVSSSMKYYRNNFSGSLFMNYKNFTFNFYNASMDFGVLGVNPAWQFSGGEGQSWDNYYRTFADIGYAKELGGGYNINLNLTYNYFTVYTHTKRVPSTEGASSTLGEVTLSGPLMDKMNFILGSVVSGIKRETTASPKIVEFYKNYYSGYTQIDYKPIDSLKLIAGMQYNKPQDIDGVVVPRAAGVYQLTDMLGAKVSYAEAFRAPWPMETLVNFPGVLVGNPSLTPEKVKTTDVQLMYNSPKNQSSLTLFNSDYTDLITRQTITGGSTYRNSGTMALQGIEIESKISITSRVYLEGSGTYQDEKDDKVLTPNYMVKAGVSYHTGFGLTASIFDNYFGEPKKNAGAVVNPEAKAVQLVSVNLNYTVPAMKSLSFNLYVQNALDQEYYYPEFSKGWTNTLPLESGRAVYGTASYKF